MIYTITLLLIFIYFKIARVHKKEEKLNKLMFAQHIVFLISVLFTLAYSVINIEWYIIIPVVILFSILASFFVTAIQLGIFVDGKPKFGLQKLYKIMPVLTLIILLLSSSLLINII